MRKKIKKFIGAVMVAMISMSSISVQALEVDAVDKVGKAQSEDIIVINNQGYNAEEFMDRVISCTKATVPLDSLQDKNGNIVKFEYNEKRQRVKKITENGTTVYVWDDCGNICTEILPNGEVVDYAYGETDGNTITELRFRGNVYNYIWDEKGIISGLSDATGQVICLYEYNEFGLPLYVYEVDGNRYIEHRDNDDDDFIGCINSIRYTGNCYDVETSMYCAGCGSYYAPENNEVLGSGCIVDMNELFGDQYDTLALAYENDETTTSARLTSNEIYDLTYAAAQYYANGIDYYTGKGEGDSWYTAYSGGKEYYLIARIIYGENAAAPEGDPTLETYLRYNRQGVGWEILNRYLEDEYRYSIGKGLFYSATGTTVPSFYSVLTKSSAFTSLNGNEAKSEIFPSKNVAYQEAFYIAACMKVCDNFEEWNAIVPRPTGVTHQCYNRGSLGANSKPASNWSDVIFPGWSTDYTGASNYSKFAYYSQINSFNVLFSYPSEDLWIKKVYYSEG